MGKTFQSAGLLWWLIIPVAIVFSGCFAHYPSILPFERLGAIGAALQQFNRHFHPLIVIAFWATIVAHLYEASLAKKICQKLRMDSFSSNLWMIQTFILGQIWNSLSIDGPFLFLGYPSLRILKGYLHEQQRSRWVFDAMLLVFCDCRWFCNSTVIVF